MLQGFLTRIVVQIIIHFRFLLNCLKLIKRKLNIFQCQFSNESLCALSVTAARRYSRTLIRSLLNLHCSMFNRNDDVIACPLGT